MNPRRTGQRSLHFDEEDSRSFVHHFIVLVFLHLPTSLLQQRPTPNCLSSSSLGLLGGKIMLGVGDAIREGECRVNWMCQCRGRWVGVWSRHVIFFFRFVASSNNNYHVMLCRRGTRFVRVHTTRAILLCDSHCCFCCCCCCCWPIVTATTTAASVVAVAVAATLTLSVLSLLLLLLMSREQRLLPQS